MNLSKNVKVILIEAGAASGTTDLESDVVDMLGFEGAMFIGSLATANAANYAKVQQCDTSGGSYADLEGTKLVPGDNGDSFLIDIYRPRERYLKLYLERGGAATVSGDIYVILYGPRVAPTSHGATIDAETHIEPAEGTA